MKHFQQIQQNTEGGGRPNRQVCLNDGTEGAHTFTLLNTACAQRSHRQHSGKPMKGKAVDFFKVSCYISSFCCVLMLFFNIIFKLYFGHFIFLFFNALTERVKCFH